MLTYFSVWPSHTDHKGNILRREAHNSPNPVVAFGWLNSTSFLQGKEYFKSPIHILDCITRCLTPNRSQHPSNHLPLLDQNIENWKGYRKKLQITSTDRNTLSWGSFQSSPKPSLQQKAIYKITSDGRIKKPLLVIYLNLPSNTKPADDTIQMKTFTMSFPSFDENQTMSAIENALYT